jgi:hypothetical protein
MNWAKVLIRMRDAELGDAQGAGGDGHEGEADHRVHGPAAQQHPGVGEDPGEAAVPGRRGQDAASAPRRMAIASAARRDELRGCRSKLSAKPACCSAR